MTRHVANIINTILPRARIQPNEISLSNKKEDNILIRNSIFLLKTVVFNTFGIK